MEQKELKKNMEKEIERLIIEVEEKLINEGERLNMVNAEYVLQLFHIHNELWTLLYFKKNQEKDYLNTDSEGEKLDKKNGEKDDEKSN